MVGVEEGLVQEALDVVVRGGVVHEGALAAALHQACQSKFGQVLTHRGWCGTGEFRQARH
jgi:hypothetical protein